MVNERFTIRQKEENESYRSFADDVRLGLTSFPKFLLPKYFYDELGSVLFEAITLLPEYYPTRDEREILSNFAAEIVNSIEGEITLLELGSGSASKTAFLIDAVFSRQPALTYIPIEISRSALEASSKRLLEEFSGLEIKAFVGNYLDILKDFKRDDSRRALILFLGSSIGNLSVDESIELLKTIGEILSSGDALLLGADLKKSKDILEPAYDDSLGVTAAFNLNFLARINKQLSANFDIRSFKHIAFYNSELERIEMHLESRKEQTVSIENLNLEVNFAPGERIHTENSYKYDLSMLSNLALKTGFELKHTWFDSHSRFSSNLFLVV